MTGTRVTAEDVTTGESESVVIRDNFIVICDGKYRVASEQRYSNGTVNLTLKPDAVVDEGDERG